MAVRIDKGKALDGINLTPMIDCVFLLLIFFLVATKFEEAEREMKVVLPQASEAVPLTSRPKELIVNVDSEGHFIVNRQTLSADALLNALLQAAANNPGRQKVLIRADKHCAWQHVAAVMDLCNKARIRDYTASMAEPS